MPEPLPAKMEQVHANISVEDSEREMREQEIRNNQDIFTAQKKVLQAKNIKPRNEMKVGKERLEEAGRLVIKLRLHIDEERPAKNDRPIAPPTVTDVTSGIKKLSLDSKCEPTGPPKFFAVKPSTHPSQTRCVEPKRKTETKLCDVVIRTHGPDKGSPRPSAGRDGDDVNPAKYSRPAPSGAVDDLNTPQVGEVEKPAFPSVDDMVLEKALANMGAEPVPYQYVQHASPGSDSGYSNSGSELSPISPVSLDLPQDVEILLDQFFYCGMSEQDVLSRIWKMNLSLDTQDRIEAKIVAWMKEQEEKQFAPDMAPALHCGNTNEPTLTQVVHGKRLPGLDGVDGTLGSGVALEDQVEESPFPDLDLPDPPGGLYTPVIPGNSAGLYRTPDDSPSMPSVPSIDLPVPVTAERRTPAQPAASDSMRATDNQGGMRTEPLSGWGHGSHVRRHMTDISKFVQYLPDSERAELRECQEIIKKQSPSEVTKINENGDTLLHLYMIYSPEVESDKSKCPPRRKMKLLLYCLLERLAAMGRLDELINMRNDRGQTPLYLAACGVNFPLAVQMFLHFGADPNIRTLRDNDGPAPIHKVVERGDDCLETLNYLLASDKCDPNLFYEGMTPLMIASRAHLSKYLNPDTNVTAPVSTRQCVVALLSSSKVDAFAKSASSGRAALHYAVEKKNVDLVSAWREFADREHPTEITPQKNRLKLINVADRDGNNVLHILAGLTPFDKQLDLARLLLAMGAELTKRNGEKKMPRDLARSMKNKDLTDLFALPKTRKSSNPARQRFSQSRSGSDDSPRSHASFDFNPAAAGYQFAQLSPGSSVFGGDSSQRISPPIAPTTQPVIDFSRNTYGDAVYMFNANGQVTTYSTIGSTPSLVSTQAPFVEVNVVGGASPPQGPVYGSSGGFSPESGSSGGHSPGSQYQQFSQHGGHPQQFGGVSPQHGGVSPQHGGVSPQYGGVSPQRGGQYSGHSPQHAAQHSPQGSHSPRGGHSPQHYQQQLSPQYQQMLGGLSPQRLQTTTANLVPIQTTVANLVPIQTTAANLVPTTVNLAQHVTTCPPGYVPTTVHGQHHVTTWSRADHVAAVRDYQTDSDDNPFAGVFTTHN